MLRTLIDCKIVFPLKFSFDSTRLDPLSSDRQHLSYDVCLEVRGGLSELFCVVLCTEAVHSHKHT